MTGWTWRDDATGWVDHHGTPLIPDRAARYWRERHDVAYRWVVTTGTIPT